MRHLLCNPTKVFKVPTLKQPSNSNKPAIAWRVVLAKPGSFLEWLIRYGPSLRAGVAMQRKARTRGTPVK
jgi:hypothetical protein